MIDFARMILLHLIASRPTCFSISFEYLEFHETLRKKIDGAIKVCMQDPASLVRPFFSHVPTHTCSGHSYPCRIDAPTDAYRHTSRVPHAGPAATVVKMNIGWRPVRLGNVGRKVEKKERKEVCKDRGPFSMLLLGAYSTWHTGILGNTFQSTKQNVWMCLVCLVLTGQDTDETPLPDVDTSRLDGDVERRKSANSRVATATSQVYRLHIDWG